MPKDWEQMSASEKLSSLRAEVDSLNRVTKSVARRIEEIRNELKAIESVVSARKEDGKPQTRRAARRRGECRRPDRPGLTPQID
jgi:peptidoglycan hydrolase CwlO-like protein